MGATDPRGSNMRRVPSAQESHPLLQPETSTAPHVKHSIIECARIVLLDMRSIETFSAWSNLAACILFTAYVGVRVLLFDTHTLPGRLSTASIVIYAITFGISTVYHITATKRVLSKTFVAVNQAAVLISFAVSIATDVSIACCVGSQLSIRMWLDIVLAALLTIVFFALQPMTDHRNTWLSRGSIEKGTQRHHHSDVIHTNTRRGTALCLLLGWLPTSYLLLVNNPGRPGQLMLAAYGSGVVCIVASQINDTLELTDRWLPIALKRHRRCCTVDAHGLWHVVSTLATIFLVSAREYALQQTGCSILDKKQV